MQRIDYLGAIGSPLYELYLHKAWHAKDDNLRLRELLFISVHVSILQEARHKDETLDRIPPTDRLPDRTNQPVSRAILADLL